MKPVINLKQVIDVKSIIKTTLLSGFTAALWVVPLVGVSCYFNWTASELLKSFAFNPNIPPDAFFPIALALFSWIPILILGMLLGFLISLFWNCIPEHITKDNKIISSLKYRTRSFGAYCLFIGEGFLGIVALISLPLCIQGFISTPGGDWMNDGTPLKLAVGVLVTALSVWLVRRSEVHIAEERQSAAQSLPAKKRHYPIGVMFTAAFGVLLILLLAINMIAAFCVR